MPLAKGLGGGVPIGAVVAKGAAATVLGPGNHGSTFGGNPLAMRAALEVLAVMQEDNLLDNALACGAIISNGLSKALAGVDGVVQIRGRGLMIGIELDRPCAALVDIARQAGLLINVTGEKVVRLLPPLIVTSSQAQQLVDILSPLMIQFLTSSPGAKAA